VAPLVSPLPARQPPKRCASRVSPSGRERRPPPPSGARASDSCQSHPDVGGPPAHPSVPPWEKEPVARPMFASVHCAPSSVSPPTFNLWPAPRLHPRWCGDVRWDGRQRPSENSRGASLARERLILTAPSPYRFFAYHVLALACIFHFAPLPQAGVEKIFKERPLANPRRSNLPRNSRRAPGPRHRNGWSTPPPSAAESHLRILEPPRKVTVSHVYSRTLRGLGQDRDSSFEVSDRSASFLNGLLNRSPLNYGPSERNRSVRTCPLAKELESLARICGCCLVLRRHLRF